MSKTHDNPNINPNTSSDAYFKNVIERFESILTTFLSDVFDSQAPNLISAFTINPAQILKEIPLYRAIPYSVLNGGKRLRPLLIYLVGYALDVAPKRLKSLDAAAIAVELIHCYSLIHDDLPAMDDDNLRRGKPTCHKAFDEATAILAGDGLQAMAFQILSDPNLNPISAIEQSLMINNLATSVGPIGMVGGQALDMFYDGRGNQATLEMLCQIHRKKTGALIEASVLLGAIAAGITEKSILEKLARYAQAMGLMFQVQDDILDELGSTEKLGKTAGKDCNKAKATFPAQLGIEGAKQYAIELQNQAQDAITFLNEKNQHLIQLSQVFINRIS